MLTRWRRNWLLLGTGGVISWDACFLTIGCSTLHDPFRAVDGGPEGQCDAVLLGERWIGELGEEDFPGAGAEVSGADEEVDLIDKCSRIFRKQQILLGRL